MSINGLKDNGLSINPESFPGTIRTINRQPKFPITEERVYQNKAPFTRERLHVKRWHHKIHNVYKILVSGTDFPI